MKWHTLQPGDTLVAEASQAVYTVLSIEPSKYYDRLTVTMLELTSGKQFIEDVLNGPLDFFQVVKRRES